MAWSRFPYPDPSYVYSEGELKRAWKRLHAGDAERWPRNPALAEAWIAFHAGEFAQAAKLGLEQGMDGYAVANKATCIYANYLEKSGSRKAALFEAVAARCLEQQEEDPADPAGFYWHAYALGRSAQDLSVLKALAQGIGTKVRSSLDSALKLAPQHADAHIALGVWHAEIIDKAGALVGALTYGASRQDSVRHFRKALELHPGSAIARVEYAAALAMLDGKQGQAEALALRREAAAMTAHDAMERLDIERARTALEG